MDLKHISDKLNEAMLATLRHLLPAGVVNGSEYCVGGLDGSKGQSLRVHMSGPKAGVWSDFATGETGGDLVDLWMAARGVKLTEAMDEARAWLGIERPTIQTKRKEYKPPVRPDNLTKVGGKVEAYLASRGINEDTIKAFRVAAAGNRVVFPFLDPEGNTVMIKTRDVDDKKRQAPTSAEQMPILFGWQAVSENAREVWITEGEFDAMAAYQMGVSALSVPFGGGKGAKQQWIENEYDRLDRFASIVLAMDMDEEGQLAAREIAERLGIHRCTVVQMPLKDLNDCLLGGIDIADIRRTARAFDPEELRSATDYRDDIIKEMTGNVDDQRGFAPRFAGMRGRFRARDAELIILNGINGHGKSQLAGQLSLDAMEQGLRVCIASMEMPARRLLSRLTRQAGGVGDMTEPYINATVDWYAGKLWLFDLVGSAKVDRMLEVFDYARRRYGIDVFIVDNMSKCGIPDDDYAAQKSFIERLCDFKNSTGTTVFLVTHSRKGDSEETHSNKMDVKGSGSITDLADSVLTIWRNKTKERKVEEQRFDEEVSAEVASMPDSKLFCFKQRNGEWEGTVSLWWSQPTMQFLDYSSARPHRYVQFSVDRPISADAHRGEESYI